jgi:hypothetical protein
VGRISIVVFLFLFACRSKDSGSSGLFVQMEDTGIEFKNSIENTKDFNIFSYRNFYNGGGVGIGDVNNDGLADVFFTANMGSNKLYLNKGNWQFEDVTDRAGLGGKDKWSTGVVMVDINSDGWLDIYVCNAGYLNSQAPQSKLYINDGKLGFKDSAQAYGLANNGGYTTHAAFFDYDLDGDLDAFIINNSFIPVNTLNYANTRDLPAKDWPVKDFLKGGGDHLLRNDNGKFVDVSSKSGIHGSLISFGLGVTVGDVNGDRYPDVYISNDFFERDYLYMNQRDGTFRDELEQRVGHTSLSSMGADMADVNNDGLLDLFVTDMLPDDDYRLKTTTSFENIDVYKVKEKAGFYHQYMQNTLQLNNGNGTFSDIANYSGVAASDWSWGGLMFDADNDGLTDLFVCNGIYNDVTDQDFIDFFANDVIQKMVLTGEKAMVDEIISQMPSNPIPNKAFRNLGNMRFEDVAKNWGLDQPSFSNGAAYGDLDNDGDLDLIVNNVNQNAFIYKNTINDKGGNNFVSLTLKGRAPNTFAVGTNVKIFSDDRVITRELMPARGFQSSVDYKIVAGIGNAKADSIVLTWPDNSVTVLRDVTPNKTIEVSQPDSNVAMKTSDTASVKPLFQRTTAEFDKHIEDNYLDFYAERNLISLLSREGPKAAYGDVNGDKLVDVYIPGGSGQGGQLYLQTSKGFVKKAIEAFTSDTKFEGICAVFFDADKDRDLDLFVGAGGNNHPPGSPLLQHRMYQNDGKGNFTSRANAFPANSMNISVAAANDFDGDGDVDLFVGGRSIPSNYGLAPTSYLYRNEGTGTFTDVAKNTGIDTAGMITGAVWHNVAGGNAKELIVVGEWMSPKIFSFEGNSISELKTNLAAYTGWWQSVSVADMDGNGIADLILGNIGENFYLRPGKEQPVKMFINDFDQNGTADKIITRHVAGKDVPVFLKRDLTDQIVSLKKLNLRYAEFAKKGIQDLFPEQYINGSVVREFTYSSSCIAYNQGNGNFIVETLPSQVQLSCTNSSLCTDIDSDGKMDLIVGGNQFGFLPQFGRLDANPGLVLLNKGSRKFTTLPQAASGLNLRGQVRDIVEIPSSGGKYILILQNNELPLLYRQAAVRKEKADE